MTGFTPTFAQRETMFGTENRAPDAAYCLAGIPYDIGTTNRAGTREGPAAVRLASRMVGGSYPDLPDDLNQLDFADIGNFGLVLGDIPQSLALIEQQAGQFDHLISIGGDHTISLPLLRAAAKKHGPLGLVHFDAHVDTWPENYGQVFSHGSNFYHAINEGIVDPQRMIQIGIRCRVAPAVWQWTLDQGVTIISAEDVHMSSPAAIVDRINTVVGAGKTYLTFDIDGLDPAFAPGTGTPEIGGLHTWQARAIMTRLADIDFVGMDLVEVMPSQDIGEITALAGATMIAFYLGLQRRRLV